MHAMVKYKNGLIWIFYGGALFFIGWLAFIQCLVVLKIISVENVTNSMQMLSPVFGAICGAFLGAFRYQNIKVSNDKVYKLSLARKTFLLALSLAVGLLAFFRIYDIVKSNNGELMEAIILTSAWAIVGMLFGAFLSTKKSLDDFKLENIFKIR